VPNKNPLSGVFLKAIVSESPRLLCSVAFCHEAVATQNWASTLLDWARLEWNLASVTALCTCCIVHFALSVALVLAVIAAILAALWSAEVLASKELLLTFREGERLAAIAAGDLLISHTNERKKVMCRHPACEVLFPSFSFSL
jgi:hypothetical protein